MYKDKDLEEKGYIEDIHMMTIEEANALETDSMRATGGYYRLASTNTINSNDYNLGFVNEYGEVSGSGGSQYCLGVRPVIVLIDNIYVISGTGTEADPYILGKD